MSAWQCLALGYALLAAAEFTWIGVIFGRFCREDAGLQSSHFRLSEKSARPLSRAPSWAVTVQRRIFRRARRVG